MTYRVVLTDHVFPDEDAVIEQKVLEGANAQLEIHECRDEEDLLKIVRYADGLLVERAPITKRVIGAMERCRVITRYGVGYDCIDIDAATEAGIPVCNVPNYCVPEVADHTLSMLLALARSTFRLDAEVRRGIWDVYSGGRTNQRLEGLILGMIGWGRIGRAVAKRAAAFGFDIAVYDPYVEAASVQGEGARKVTLEELLRTADFVTLHVPLSAATHHLLDAEKIGMLKPTAFVVNTARGSLIDQRALTRALEEGRIAGAGLDVLEQEPPSLDDPLLKLPNVIINSHAAFYSPGASRDLHRMAAEEVAIVLQGNRPRSLVNRTVLDRI